AIRLGPESSRLHEVTSPAPATADPIPTAPAAAIRPVKSPPLPYRAARTSTAIQPGCGSRTTPARAATSSGRKASATARPNASSARLLSLGRSRCRGCSEIHMEAHPSCAALADEPGGDLAGLLVLQ